jgi:hypothetical protein
MEELEEGKRRTREDMEEYENEGDKCATGPYPEPDESS